MVLLKSLPLLEHLDLSDTLVTNAGLVHLEALKHIRCVSLSYTGGAHSASQALCSQCVNGLRAFTAQLS